MIVVRVDAHSPESSSYIMKLFKITDVAGSGGGTSGRAMAFCPGWLGSNPGSDFGFFQLRIAVNLFSLGVGLFIITCNRTVHNLPSSFLFPIIIYHCENY